MKCLRRILGIKWTDKVTNNDVLEQANVYSLTSIIRQQRLRWLGHVTRMDDNRIPKHILFGQLVEGTRRRGRPLLRYKDILRRETSWRLTSTQTLMQSLLPIDPDGV